MYSEQRLLEQQEREKKKKEGQSWRHLVPTVEHWAAQYSKGEIGVKLKEQRKEDGIKILEALSATGLRSIRYFKEIPGTQSILVNDIDKTAVEAISRNLQFNKITDAKD